MATTPSSIRSLSSARGGRSPISHLLHHPTGPCTSTRSRRSSAPQGPTLPKKPKQKKQQPAYHRCITTPQGEDVTIHGRETSAPLPEPHLVDPLSSEDDYDDADLERPVHPSPEQGKTATLSPLLSASFSKPQISTNAKTRSVSPPHHRASPILSPKKPIPSMCLAERLNVPKDGKGGCHSGLPIEGKGFGQPRDLPGESTRPKSPTRNRSPGKLHPLPWPPSLTPRRGSPSAEQKTPRRQTVPPSAFLESPQNPVTSTIADREPCPPLREDCTSPVTFLVDTLAEALQLDEQGDGTFNGLPIEIKDTGLYSDIMKPLHHPEPGSVVITKMPDGAANLPYGLKTRGLQSFKPTVKSSKGPAPQSIGSIGTSGSLPSSMGSVFSSPLMSPQSFSTVLSPKESLSVSSTPVRERDFEHSYFKAAYDAAKAPATVAEFLVVLQTLVTRQATMRCLDPTITALFFEDLKEIATKESDFDVPNAAARVWTSPKTLEKREIAFILNEALRADNPELMAPLATFTRAMNLLLVGLSRISMAPASNVVYRGGGLPDQHREFFVAGKKYRSPMFLATSVNRSLCLKTFCRRAQVNQGHPPVLWIIGIDEKEGCKHVNYIHTTECLEEQEYLFSPYSVFTVVRTDWKPKPDWKDPHVIYLRAAIDNRLESEDLPIAPWS